MTSNIEQRTDWSFEYNHRLALTAEAAGFDYALAQARFFASYGADKQLEAVTTATALAAVTTKLNVRGRPSGHVEFGRDRQRDRFGQSHLERAGQPRVSDVLFINGGSVEHIANLVEDVRRRAARYNDGFKPQLIGTPAFIAERIQRCEAAGIDILLTRFLQFIEEVDYLGWSVSPLVRGLPSLRAREIRAVAS